MNRAMDEQFEHLLSSPFPKGSTNSATYCDITAAAAATAANLKFVAPSELRSDARTNLAIAAAAAAASLSLSFSLAVSHSLVVFPEISETDRIRRLRRRRRRHRRRRRRRRMQWKNESIKKIIEVL